MAWVTVYKYTPGKGFGPVQEWVPDRGTSTTSQRAGDQPKAVVPVKKGSALDLRRQRQVAAAAKKERERIAAEARKKAYETLMEQTAKRRSLLETQLERKRTQEVKKAQLADTSSSWVDTSAGKVQTKQGHAATLLAEAKKTGDYSLVFKDIADKQTATGGRYVNKAAYEAGVKGWQEAYTAALKLQTSWEKRITKLVKKGDFRAAKALFATKGWKNDVEKLRLFGLSSQKVIGLQQSISSEYDRFMSRTTLSINSPGNGIAQQAALTAMQEAADKNDPNVRGREDRGNRQEKTLADYLRGVRATEVAKYEAARNGMIAKSNLLKAEGYVFKQAEPGGPGVWQQARDKGFMDSLTRTLGPDARWLLQQVAHGNSVDRARAFDEILKKKTEELRLQMEKEWGGQPTSGTVPTDASVAWHKEWLQRRKAMEAELYQGLLNQQAPTGLAAGLAGLGRVPVMSEVLKALAVPVGGIFGMARFVTGTVNGNVRLGGGPQAPIKPSMNGDTVLTPAQYTAAMVQYRADMAKYTVERQKYEAEESAGEVSAWNDFHSVVIQHDLGKTLEAVGSYGAEPFDNGFLNFVLPSIVDPLNAVAPLKWLKAGSAAIGRAGGLMRAFDSVEHAAATLKMARTLSRDQNLLRAVLNEADRGKVLGPNVAPKVAAEMRLEELFARGADGLQAETSRLAAMFGVPEPAMKQLLEATMSRIAEEAIVRGAKGITGHELAGLMKDATDAERRAGLAIKAEKAEARLAADVAKGRAAVGADRAATYGPQITADRAARAAAITREVAEHRTIATRYGIRPGSDPFVQQDALRQAAMGRVPAGTFDRRAWDTEFQHVTAPYKQARLARERIEQRLAAAQARLGDTYSPTGNAQVKRARTSWEKRVDDYEVVRGQIAEHLRTLADARADDAGRQQAYTKLQKLVGEARKYEDSQAADGSTILGRLNQARESYDHARVAGGMRDLRSTAMVLDTVAKNQIDNELAAVDRALAAARASGNRTLMRDLAASSRYLKRERLRTAGRGATADEVVRRYRAEATDYMRSGKLVAKVRSSEGAVEEGMRDLQGRYRELPDAGESLALDAGEEAQLASLRSGIAGVDVDLSDPRLAGLDGSLRGRSLEDAFMAMAYLGNEVAYRDAFAAIYKQVADHVSGLGDPADLRKLLRREHYGTAFGMDLYETMDAAIAARFHARGRRAAKGSYVGGHASGQPSASGRVSALRSADRNLDDLLDKIDVARDHGTTIYAYDDVRPLFRAPLKKVRASEAVFREADFEAAQSGRSFDETYEEALAKRVKYERDEWLRRDAYDMAGTGASPEAIWADFVARNSDDDLFEHTMSRGVTPWQRAQMKQALIDFGGIKDPDDLAEVFRALGGGVRVPQGAIRLLTEEEFPGAAVGIPGFVVPDNSPKLAILTGTHPALGRMIGGDGVYVAESVANDVVASQTIVHEWGHVLHQGSQQAVDTILDDALGVASRAAPPASISSTAADPFIQVVMETTGSVGRGEFFAQFYAIWAHQARPMLTRLGDGSLLQSASWSELRALFPGKAKLFDDAEALFPTLVPPVKLQFGIRGFNAPPFHLGQAAVYKWLSDNGFWAKRTGDQIAAGGKVWSVEMERTWFESRFGFTPEWTKEEVIRKAFSSQEAFDEYRRAGGFADNVFETQVLGSRLVEGDLKDALAFGGGEMAGIKKQRTPAEVRRYLAGRFGSIVSDDEGKTLKLGYWLMDPRKPEYEAWMKTFVSESIGHNVSEFVAKDLVDRRRVMLPPGLMKPAEVDRFTEILVKTVKRHMDYAERDLKKSLWLPEVQLRVALDVTDQLMGDKAWRAMLDRPLAGDLIRKIGWVQRMTVMFSGAFALVNSFERAVFRGPISQLAHTDVHLLGHIDDDARRTIQSMASINIGSTGMIEARTRTGIAKLRDPRLERKAHAMGLVQAVAEAPLMVSAIGETRMQLHFARRTYMSFRDSFIRDGMDPTLARVEAMIAARKRIVEIFALSEDGGTIEKALNALVPFFSYNLRTMKVYLTMVAAHPSIINIQNRLGNLVEDMNREQWEAEHPDGPPWDPTWADARTLWVKLGDTTYAVDLSQYSDMLRAGQKTVGSKAPETLPDWFGQVIRIPHPLQEGFWALITGGEAPWGKPDWSDFFWPADLAKSLGEIGDDKQYADTVEMLSDLLTWNRWKRVDPAQKGAMFYWGLLRAKRYTEAEKFLAGNAQVRALVQSHDPRAVYDPTKVDFTTSYWRYRPSAAKRAFDEDMAAWKEIRATYDEKKKAYWDQPWSDELKAIKKEERAVLDVYLVQHPDLMGVFAGGMTPGEWAQWGHDADVDEQVDAFFSMTKAMEPQRGKYADGDRGELQYRRDLRKYNVWREKFLDEHPEVEARITYAANDLQAAWRDWEAQRAARFDIINDLTIKRLHEELSGGDRELVSDLYDIVGYYWDLQNTDGAWSGIAAFDQMNGHPLGWSQTASSAMHLSTAITLPGLERLKVARMTAAEKVTYLAEKGVNDRFSAGMDHISKTIDGAGLKGKDAAARFYRELEKDPWLLEEYFKRNEDKRANYEAGKAYFGWMQRWASHFKKNDYRGADRVWASMPAWVKERYYKTHGKQGGKARASGAYVSAMGTWVGLLKKKDYDGARAYWHGLPQWVRDRYYAKHPDQRFSLDTTLEQQQKLAHYFMADDVVRAEMLKRDPVLRSLLSEYDSDGQRRSLVMETYRSLTDPWAKRAFRERYPEYFSKEAEGDARLRSVAKKLRAHPELRKAWEEAVKMQYLAHQQELTMQGVRPPKPLDVVHLRDVQRKKIRIRRRAARFSAHWKSHEELRHG